MEGYRSRRGHVALCVHAYVIDTTVLAIYTMVTLGYRRWGVVFISAVSITAVVFFVFKVLLNVPLPMLFFEF